MLAWRPRGLLSRDGIVPLALSVDTGGAMARNVHDALKLPKYTPPLRSDLVGR